MQTFRKLLTIAIFLGLTMTSVKAAIQCDSKTTAELNREVGNIKATYEILKKAPEGIIGVDWYDPETMTLDDLPKVSYVKVNITNLSEKFRAEVTNDLNEEKINLTNADVVDGVASFEWEDLSYVAKITIKIYTTKTTGCENQLFKTINLTLPRFNSYSENIACKQVPNYYLCQPYVTYKENEDLDFYAVMEKILNNEEQEEEKPKKEKNWLKDNLTSVIIGGILLVGVGTTTTILIIRNRRRREI